MCVRCASHHSIHILKYLTHGNFVYLTSIYTKRTHHLKITTVTVGRIPEYVHVATKEGVSNSIHELILLDKSVPLGVSYLKRSLLVEMK
jgi:hypothetical protein